MRHKKAKRPDKVSWLFYVQRLYINDFSLARSLQFRLEEQCKC